MITVITQGNTQDKKMFKMWHKHTHKPKTWRVKMLSFKMWSNLSYQLKTDRYRYKLIYVSLMITTKQNPMVRTQKIKRKESKHRTKESNKITKKKSKRRQKQREIIKQTEKQLHTYQ